MTVAGGDDDPLAASLAVPAAVSRAASIAASLARSLPGHRVRRVRVDEWPVVQAIFDTDPSYFERVELAPMRPDEGRHIFEEAPASVPAEHKHLFVVDDVAVLDFLEGYPEPHIWYLGLVFVSPAARGRGFGTRLLHALCDGVRAGGGTALRLAVMHGNAARRLYDRLGFAFVAERVRTSWNGAQAPCDVLQLELAAHAVRAD